MCYRHESEWVILDPICFIQAREIQDSNPCHGLYPRGGEKRLGRTGYLQGIWGVIRDTETQEGI